MVTFEKDLAPTWGCGHLGSPSSELWRWWFGCLIFLYLLGNERHVRIQAFGKGLPLSALRTGPATSWVSSWSSSLGLWDRSGRAAAQHLRARLGLLRASV